MSKSHIPTQMTTMSKAEAIQMLKDAGVEPSKIAMLDNGEMAQTEGEFWWFLVPVLLGGLLGYATNRTTYDPRPIPSPPKGYTFTYSW